MEDKIDEVLHTNSQWIGGQIMTLNQWNKKLVLWKRINKIDKKGILQQIPMNSEDHMGIFWKLTL
jgi:hypothetical protein